MSHKNQYKIQRLVSNIEGTANYFDNGLRAPGGLLLDNHTLWSGNNGSEGVENNLSKYTLEGQHLLTTHLIFTNIPYSLPLQLLYDMAFLYKNVEATLDGGVIVNIPPSNTTPNQPVVPPGFALAMTTNLNQFLTTPDSPTVDITKLVTFCNNIPNDPSAPPLNFEQMKAFLNASQAVSASSFDVTDTGKAFLAAQALLAAQNTLPPGVKKTTLSTPVKSTKKEILPLYDPVPMGLVINNSHNFVIKSKDKKAASYFIAVTADGTIHGYNQLVDANAIEAVNNNLSASVYTGVSIVGNNLYVTDFANAAIHTFNFNFEIIREPKFSDPKLPMGYAPINIVNINDLLYVTYAKIDLPSYARAARGPGFGYINLFKPDGTLIKRLVSGGPLNVPYGLVVAPEHFGKFGGKFLVANHGDGKINVYDKNWNHIGKLKNKCHEEIVLDGLWSLVSHNRSVYFSSGPKGINGLLGKINSAI